MKVHRNPTSTLYFRNSRQQEGEHFNLYLEIQAHSKIRIICLELLKGNKMSLYPTEESSLYLQGGKFNDFYSENHFFIDPLHKQIYLLFFGLREKSDQRNKMF